MEGASIKASRIIAPEQRTQADGLMSNRVTWCGQMIVSLLAFAMLSVRGRRLYSLSGDWPADFGPSHKNVTCHASESQSLLTYVLTTYPLRPRRQCPGSRTSPSTSLTDSEESYSTMWLNTNTDTSPCVLLTTELFLVAVGFNHSNESSRSGQYGTPWFMLYIARYARLVHGSHGTAYRDVFPISTIHYGAPATCMHSLSRGPQAQGSRKMTVQ